MRFSRFLLPAVFLSFATLAGGDPPSWWSQAHSSDPQLAEPDLPPVLTTAAANNKGPANIGQAKHMARSALLALRQVAPQVAANVESELVGNDKPILSWEGPADQAERDKNRAPLLIGQLKAIAAPFYESLHAAEPDWLEVQLTASQTKDPADPDHFYPWTSGTTDDQNKAPATIGQLKAVFSLDFASLSTGGHDGDGDGVPDAWELEFLREIAALFDLSNLPQTAAEHDVTHDYTGIGVTASATYARQEASNGSGAPSAVFNSGVLYPDGNPYYYTDGKSPVRYQAFVESASGVSTSYFESSWKSVTAAENVYTKCTVNSTRVSTHGTSSSTYTYDSELNTVLTLSPPKDFVYDDIGNWGFVARVQDLRCSLSGNIRTVSSYTEDADDPPSKVVKIENSANYSDLIYEPYISTGWFYGEGESGDVPIVTWETVTTKKDGSKTYASSNSEANVSHRLALGSIRFSDSSDPLRYDASGAGFSETAVLSELYPGPPSARSCMSWRRRM